MSFGDNLRAIRKQKNISQEDLAGRLNVSRQAISKWEQNSGYPEMEKVIQLAEILDISLDHLILGRTKEGKSDSQTAAPSGRIMIRSQDGKQLAGCYKAVSSRISCLKKSADMIPQYALYGVDSQSFWGESRILLGYYSDANSIREEINQILLAIEDGMVSYKLKYAIPEPKISLRMELKKLLKLG